MAKRKTKSEDDFLRNMEALDDSRFSDILAEGVACNTPSELGDDASAWVKSQGWTPIEFLTHAYRNPWNELRDRISAAKAVLDYVHKKLPQKIEVDGNVTETKKISADGLSKLSDKELETFMHLVEKIGGET